MHSDDDILPDPGEDHGEPMGLNDAAPERRSPLPWTQLYVGSPKGRTVTESDRRAFEKRVAKRRKKKGYK